MAYEALYTKARPKNLAQLVGQEHISKSLARALNQDRLSHAYLLVGTRGTGKTSTARILARAINCDTVHDAKENQKILPADKIPCNECESCKTFKSSPDNIEFDAASNRSVEDISRLLSTAYLAPLQSRYKTYIIDEVHMLSFEAVNSILKLIEEPPPNVIFFLATTEFNKVPQTIRSRCQILNFKLIPQDIIANHIIHLAKGLNFEVEDHAVKKIARLAKGSMRDALTLFDQCYSMTDSNLLTMELVDDTLGLVSDSDLDEIIEAAKTKDRRNIIISTAKAFKSGLTAANIAESLITRLRDDVAMINNSQSAELAIYNEMIEQLRKSVIEMQGSGIPEVILETALFKFASKPAPIVVKDDFDYNDFQPSPPPKRPVKDKILNFKEHKDQIIENEIENVFDDNDSVLDEEILNSYDEEIFDEAFDDQNFDSPPDLRLVKNNSAIESVESEIDNEELISEGKKIFDETKEFFDQNDKIEISGCMKFAEVIDFDSNVITVQMKKGTISYTLNEYISEIEETIKKNTQRNIKIEIVEYNDSDTNKTSSNFSVEDDSMPNCTTARINQMPLEDREFLIKMMEIFQVKIENLQYLPINK